MNVNEMTREELQDALRVMAERLALSEAAREAGEVYARRLLHLMGHLYDSVPEARASLAPLVTHPPQTPLDDIDMMLRTAGRLAVRQGR